jgi:hypothetical protein
MIVSGLDPASRVLFDHYEKAITRFVNMPFAAVEQGTTEQLNIVLNNWDAIAERLQTFKVLSRGDGSIG